MDIILITNMELFFTMENTSQGKALQIIQSTMLSGKVPMSTAAGKKSVFLRRPSGKKLHVGKVGGYIHGAINYQLRSLPDTFRYGRKRLNTM